MAPELSRLLRRIAFLMMALATLTVEIAAFETRPLLASMGLVSGWLVVAALAALVLPVSVDHNRRPPKWVFMIVLAAFVAPVAIEPLRRMWTSAGYPLELQMVYGLRNVGLVMAALGGWSQCLRMTCVISLFLMLFAAVMTSHPAVMVIVGLYAVIGTVWLVFAYWSGLKSMFVDSESTVTVDVQSRHDRFPWTGLGILIIAVSIGLGLMIYGPQRVALTLGELMPTSGGSGETDPFARYGIGDGPEEVAGQDVKAAGMVETDRMIEDNKNSLIDAVSDMYGPPHKPPQDQERTVAAGKAEVIQFHGKLPDNRRPSRDFDTSRQGPKGGKKPTSRDARGLFEVEGRTPLHIRQVVYERFVDADQRWVEARKPSTRLIEAEEGDWMKLGHYKTSADWYQQDDRHKLKTADMSDNLVPTPTMLTRFRIGKVDKPDYYEWAYEGVIALAGRKRTPPGVIITTECRTIEPWNIPATAFSQAGLAGNSPADLGDVPPSLHSEIRRIANEWAGGHERGWSQIEAVLSRLRNDYTLDPVKSAPSGHPAPVLWFLTESRCGPDYLFATAASLLLRSLDYSTRVCLGYYASPEAYDPESAHTPVRFSDLHFWTEVRLHDGHWVVAESTPGYKILGPRLSLTERLSRWMVASLAWMERHLSECGVVAVCLIILYVRRREFIDALHIRYWRLRPGRTWRDKVKRAVVVLERRGRWAGLHRQVRQSAPNWLRDTYSKSLTEDDEFIRMTQFAEWAAYAPESTPPWPDDEVFIVCQRVLDRWTLRRWRDIASSETVMGV